MIRQKVVKFHGKLMDCVDLIEMWSNEWESCWFVSLTCLCDIYAHNVL